MAGIFLFVFIPVGNKKRICISQYSRNQSLSRHKSLVIVLTLSGWRRSSPGFGHASLALKDLLHVVVDRAALGSAVGGMLAPESTPFLRSLFTAWAIKSDFAFQSTVQIKVSLVIVHTYGP